MGRFKGVPEDTTRLAMLKKGEADIAIAFLDGAVAQEAQRDPRLRLVATQHPSLFWVEFADQWHPQSPWHDRRVRLAANYALDRQAINEGLQAFLAENLLCALEPLTLQRFRY